jgi:hypothetical protein
MMPEENKISLVMECDNSSAPKIWVLWKESSKKPAYSSAHLCVEVIENEFGIVICYTCSMVYFIAKLDVGDFEVYCRSFRKMDHYYFIDLFTIFPKYYNISIIFSLCVLLNFLQ